MYLQMSPLKLGEVRADWGIGFYLHLLFQKIGCGLWYSFRVSTQWCMFLGIKIFFFCIKEDIFLLLFHNYVCTRIFAHGLSNKIPEYMWKIFMVWLWSFVSKHRMLFGPNHLCGNKIFQYKFYAEDHNKICNNEASIYLPNITQCINFLG